MNTVESVLFLINSSKMTLTLTEDIYILEKALDSRASTGLVRDKGIQKKMTYVRSSVVA